MNPKSKLAVIIFFVLTLVFDGSATSLFRKLVKTETSEISPPLAETPNISPAPAPAPNGGLVDEKKCFRWCKDHRSLAACLQFSPTAPEEAFLYVKNDGHSPLKVNVRISHHKITFSDIERHKQGAIKINISTGIGGRPSIVLNAGYGKCVILLGQSVSNDNILKHFSFYAAHGTPIYGAYLLFLTVLTTGVTWACCKSKKSKRQGDGLPYQDLEMANPESLTSSNVVTAETWDQDWGDKWDEIEAEQSQISDELENGSANDVSAKSYARDGWENDWND